MQSLTERVSLGYVLYRTQKDFGIKNTDWMSDAKTWVQDALQMVGLRQSVELKYKDEAITNYKCYSPCDSKLIEYIIDSDNHLRLRKGTGQSIIQEGDRKEYQKESKNFWIPAYPYIRVNVQTINIRIFYWSLLISDKDKTPLIPNNPKYINAIKFYIFAHLLLSGNATSKEFNYERAMEHFNMWCSRAQNAFAMESPLDAEIQGRLIDDLIFPTFLPDDLYLGGETRSMAMQNN